MLSNCLEVLERRAREIIVAEGGDPEIPPKSHDATIYWKRNMSHARHAGQSYAERVLSFIADYRPVWFEEGTKKRRSDIFEHISAAFILGGHANKMEVAHSAYTKKGGAKPKLNADWILKMHDNGKSDRWIAKNHSALGGNGASATLEGVAKCLQRMGVPRKRKTELTS